QREDGSAVGVLESGLQGDAMPGGVDGVSWLDAHLRILTAPIWHQHQGQAALLLDDVAYQEMKAFYLGISLYGPAISRWESAKTSGDISAQINTEMQMALALLRTQAKRTD